MHTVNDRLRPQFPIRHPPPPFRINPRGGGGGIFDFYTWVRPYSSFGKMKQKYNKCNHFIKHVNISNQIIYLFLVVHGNMTDTISTQLGI